MVASSKCECGGCRAFRSSVVRDDLPPNLDPYFAVVLHALQRAGFRRAFRDLGDRPGLCEHGKAFYLFVAGGKFDNLLHAMVDAIGLAARGLQERYPDGLPQGFVATPRELGLHVMDLSGDGAPWDDDDQGGED